MRDFISGGLFSTAITSIGDKTTSNGFSPRVIAHLGAQPEPQRQHPGRQGLPTWRRQRSAEHSAVHARRMRPFSARSPDRYDDETLWNYEAGVKYSKGGQ